MNISAFGVIGAVVAVVAFSTGEPEPEGGFGGVMPEAELRDVATPDAGTRLALRVTLSDAAHRVMAVDQAGTVYGITPANGDQSLYVSTDNARSWIFRTKHPRQASFRQMTVLSDGSLIADAKLNGQHTLGRSTDHGFTWNDVLSIGAYQMLTPQSIAELDGTTYFLEYQSFTQDTVPINLWASTDHGATWALRFTFSGHRHGHCLTADPLNHALWASFGDGVTRSGLYRSTDGGRSWQSILLGSEGTSVSMVALADGSVLYGQDISYLPSRPKVVRVTPAGSETVLTSITGPAYSTYALSLGGFLVGAARESGGDIYPSGEVSAHVFGTANGTTWQKLLDYPRKSSTDTVRADVYWALPTGELILQLWNAQALAGDGSGYQLIQVIRR